MKKLGRLETFEGVVERWLKRPMGCLSTTPSEGTVGQVMFGLVFFHSRNRVLECAFWKYFKDLVISPPPRLKDAWKALGSAEGVV